MFINFMAVGLLSVAGAVRRKGYSVQVLHLGLEKSLDPAFDLAAYLAEHRPRVVGISLNWHHQSPDSMDAALLIRETLPDCFMVVGGHTASCFSRELLQTCEFIDAVVRGEGERPMAMLMDCLAGSGRLGRVPNLLWRDGPDIVENQTSWHADPEELAAMDMADFSLLSNADHYPGLFPFMFPPERKYLNRLLFKRRTTATFVVPVARGCMRNCAWCGGGAHGTRSIFGRPKVVFQDPDAVVATIEKALGQGYTTIATEFRGKAAESLLGRVLELCRKKGLKPRWNLDAWEFPSPELVGEFSATVTEDSAIEFSPDFGSEELRKKYKGYYYSNAELLSQLEMLKKKGVSAGLLFIYGLPSKEKHEREQKELLQRLYRDSNVRRVHFHACELDPMCPMSLDPDAYGIIPHVRTFLDYLEAHRSGFKMGFSLKDCAEEELFARRCESACILGRRGRYKCALIRAATASPRLDPLLYAAGRTLWGLGQDKEMAGLFSPGAK